jgi:hypothetical protein
MQLGSLGLARELTQALTQKLLAINADILVAKEYHATLRDWCNVRIDGTGHGRKGQIPRIARSLILSSSCRMSVSCRLENSRPMTEVTSNCSYESRLPEYVRGPERREALLVA